GGGGRCAATPPGRSGGGGAAAAGRSSSRPPAGGTAGRGRRTGRGPARGCRRPRSRPGGCRQTRDQASPGGPDGRAPPGGSARWTGSGRPPVRPRSPAQPNGADGWYSASSRSHERPQRGAQVTGLRRDGLVVDLALQQQVGQREHLLDQVRPLGPAHPVGRVRALDDLAGLQDADDAFVILAVVLEPVGGHEQPAHQLGAGDAVVVVVAGLLAGGRHLVEHLVGGFLVVRVDVELVLVPGVVGARVFELVDQGVDLVVGPVGQVVGHLVAGGVERLRRVLVVLAVLVLVVGRLAFHEVEDVLDRRLVLGGHVKLGAVPRVGDGGLAQAGGHPLGPPLPPVVGVVEGIALAGGV